MGGMSLLIVAIVSVFAASVTPDATMAAVPDRIVFRVVVSNTIDTRKSRVGDKVKMVVAARETLDDGTVIEPGTQLEGRIMETVSYSPARPEARLSILMDRIRLKKRWVPIHAFIIAQGQIRTTRIIDGIKSPCFDPFRSPQTAQEVYCDEDPRRVAIPGKKVSTTSPVLNNVELVLAGSPPHESCFVSQKGDIVIAENMVFLIRNVSQK